MNKDEIQTEFDRFFDFQTPDKLNVTSVSAKLFAEHIADIVATRINGALQHRRMNYTINTTKTAAVATDNYWLPVDENTPRGVKVLLLTQGDIATIGQYHPDASWVIAWCPLPRKMK